MKLQYDLEEQLRFNTQLLSENSERMVEMRMREDEITTVRDEVVKVRKVRLLLLSVSAFLQTSYSSLMLKCRLGRKGFNFFEYIRPCALVNVELTECIQGRLLWNQKPAVLFSNPSCSNLSVYCFAVMLTLTTRSYNKCHQAFT